MMQVANSTSSTHYIKGISGAAAAQPLLPLLLAVAGRAIKMPLGEGVFVSLMRLLTAIVSGCNVAARQVSRVHCMYCTAV